MKIKEFFNKLWQWIKSHIAVSAVIAASVIAAIVLAIVLPIALGGNEKCTAHVDKNDDGKCDVCSADFSDGDEIVSVNCTFTLVTDKNEPIAAAEFELSNDSETYALTTNENGVVSTEIIVGTYSISYNFDTLPENHFPDAFDVQITENTTAITLSIDDNTPDGSAAKPFWINDSVTEIALDGGEAVYYNYRSMGKKSVEIAGDNLTVICGKNTYNSQNGKVSFVVENKMMTMTSICIQNNGAEAIATQLRILSPIGTAIDNPIVLTETTATASVPQEGIVYYKWTPTQDGFIKVSSENTLNNIAISNLTTNAYSDTTNGAASTSIEVHAGDEIIITVSTTDGEAHDIAFSIDFQTADDAE